MTQLTLRVGTRRSQLALWQTNHVCALLQSAWPELRCEVVPFVTVGDKTQAAGKPLAQVGGKGLFTAELEAALRSGEIDFAVHSLKDLPTDDPQGLHVGAIPTRADARDVLIAPSGDTLDTLAQNAVVGTGSLRRAAQLRARRPDLDIRPIRGNVDTRLAKVQRGDYDAIVLAAAGVLRLGLNQHVTDWLATDVLLPAAGQGALGVQCRSNDDATMALLTVIDDEAARTAVSAERSFLAALGGGCSTPIGAYATQDDTGTVTLSGTVSALDGQRQVSLTGYGTEPLALGNRLAQEALALGAKELIAPHA